VLIQAFAGWPTAVHPLMLAVALVVALGVGIGFGSIPPGTRPVSTRWRRCGRE
jgi:hypothetical protein